MAEIPSPCTVMSPEIVTESSVTAPVSSITRPGVLVVPSEPDPEKSPVVVAATAIDPLTWNAPLPVE